MAVEKMLIDRRKEPRYDILIDVKVMTPETTLIAAAKNISGGGMEIQLPKCIYPNTQLTVSLQLDEEYIFRGTVVWTLGDYIKNQWIYRMGIQTIQIVSKSLTAKKSQERMDLVQGLIPLINMIRVNESNVAA